MRDFASGESTIFNQKWGKKHLFIDFYTFFMLSFLKILAFSIQGYCGGSRLYFGKYCYKILYKKASKKCLFCIFTGNLHVWKSMLFYSFYEKNTFFSMHHWKSHFFPFSAFYARKISIFSVFRTFFITTVKKGAKTSKKSAKCETRNSAKTIYIRELGSYFWVILDILGVF